MTVMDIWQDEISRIPSLWKEKNVVFITDGNVRHAHPGLFCVRPALVLEPGEKNKTLDTIHSVYQKFMKLEVDRSWHIVGIGGGIICDMTGFASATFLRGIPFSLVPSTLLAQTDASIGGKCGCNLNGYKNLIGTFAHPEKVVFCLNLLSTLPQREILNGFTEIFKHALVADAGFFSFLEKEGKRIIQLNRSVLEHAVTASIAIKKNIAKKDERDLGDRHILNFGHTLGHAVESEYSLSHGSSVSLGISFACFVSKLLNRLNKTDYQRILHLMLHLGLPIRRSFDPDQIMKAVVRDKKRRNGIIRFIGLSGIGSPEIIPLEISQIHNFLKKFAPSTDLAKGAGHHE